MRMLKAKTAAVAIGGSVVAGAWWWRKHPSACPYGQRFWVEAPHPIITRRRLLEVLAPRPGESILEIGPGTGYYSLDVAAAVDPEGCLDIFDLQQKMLDHTLRRAADAGVSNIRPTQGDARTLPYADELFDGAFLVTVLGEIPDPAQAVSEIARVLKPGGRLVVGELFGDPHWVRPGRLTSLALNAGLNLDFRFGTPAAFFARYEKPRRAR